MASVKTVGDQNKIIQAIERFNEIRVPEAKADLVGAKGKKFLVKFSGHMCFTCGTYDYFDDLKFDLDDLGLKTKIKNFRRINDEYLVEYQIHPVK